MWGEREMGRELLLGGQWQAQSQLHVACLRQKHATFGTTYLKCDMHRFIHGTVSCSTVELPSDVGIMMCCKNDIFLKYKANRMKWQHLFMLLQFLTIDPIKHGGSLGEVPLWCLQRHFESKNGGSMLTSCQIFPPVHQLNHAQIHLVVTMTLVKVGITICVDENSRSFCSQPQMYTQGTAVFTLLHWLYILTCKPARTLCLNQHTEAAIHWLGALLWKYEGVVTVGLCHSTVRIIVLRETLNDILFTVKTTGSKWRVFDSRLKVSKCCEMSLGLKSLLLSLLSLFVVPWEKYLVLCFDIGTGHDCGKFFIHTSADCCGLRLVFADGQVFPYIHNTVLAFHMCRSQSTICYSMGHQCILTLMCNLHKIKKQVISLSE